MTTKQADVIETRGGRVCGENRDGISVYLGIPYAAPPIGPLRWRPPQSEDSWDGTRDATQFAPAAPQTGGSLDTVLKREPLTYWNEDCLYLNVYTSGFDGIKRPVMVWFHGGSFSRGWTGDPAFNAEHLSSTGDVVVVTVGYRLGCFGFLRLCDTTNDAVPATGNEGLLDQRAALEWVRDNITLFGGDRGNVTVFGESSGGMCVSALMTMPGCENLIHKAIIQSGTAVAVNTLEEGNRLGQAFLETLETPPQQAGKLLTANPGLLLTAQDQVGLAAKKLALSWLPFRPTIDGTLPGVPQKRMEDGVGNNIPLLCGTTANEWNLYAAMNTGFKTADRDALVKLSSKILGLDRGPFLFNTYEQHFARDDESAIHQAFVEMMTDLAFRVPTTRILESRFKGGARAYNYVFNWPAPVANNGLGACHAMDVPYVFGTYEDKSLGGIFGGGEDAKLISQSMQRTWTRFARYGAPDVEYEWPAYDYKNRNTMVVGYDAGIQSNMWRELDPAWYRVTMEMLRRY